MHAGAGALAIPDNVRWGVPLRAKLFAAKPSSQRGQLQFTRRQTNSNMTANTITNQRRQLQLPKNDGRTPF
jgi:hypothetical protein